MAATLNSTTIAAAMTVSASTITLTSGTSVAAGQFYYIDKELGRFTSAVGSSTTVWNIQRGLEGTVVTAHQVTDRIWTGPGNYFFHDTPVGTSTNAAELVLPHVNVDTGEIATLDNNNNWFLFNIDSPGFRPATRYNYTATGALTVAPGIHVLTGTTLAMTLADPVAVAQDGIEMLIISATASAQTVTSGTAGFNGNTTNTDVGTFGGALGDNMRIVAINGAWWTISTRNVTLA